MVSERTYSVLIPAYNAEPTLRDALQSVLDQAVAPAEIILVDDGSTDATAAIAESMGATVLRQANQGPGAATTLGMAQVKSPFMASLDADDVWMPEKLELQFEAFERDPGLSAVFGQVADFEGETTNAKMNSPYDGWMRTTMLVRREAALATGAVIDPPGAAGDMVDWLARLREGGFRTRMLETIVALRRIRPGSMTYGRLTTNTKGYLHVAREAMMRRRKKHNEGKSN